MGNYSITIIGTGCHHNTNRDDRWREVNDADIIFKNFVDFMKKAGHSIEYSAFIHGGGNHGDGTYINTPSPLTKIEIMAAVQNQQELVLRCVREQIQNGLHGLEESVHDIQRSGPWNESTEPKCDVGPIGFACSREASRPGPFALHPEGKLHLGQIVNPEFSQEKYHPGTGQESNPIEMDKGFDAFYQGDLKNTEPKK